MEEIVKYKNRKMYSRTSSKYVKLSEIKDMVQSGKTVLISDFNGRNITSDVLRKVVALTDATVPTLETVITGAN